MKGISIVLAAASLVTATFSAQAAECVNFVRPPMAFERPSWADLESFEADKSLNPAIDQVQSIAGTGQGQLNIDQYSITISANGKTAKQLLREFRANLNAIAFTGSSYQDVKPLNKASSDLWKSEKFKGAVMVFTLDSIAGIMDTETGAVVASCVSDTDFIFSTVKVGSANTYSDPGWHPVSGNRGFGVRDNGDGTLTIFVKAADRVVNAGIFHVISNEYVFKQGAKVWNQMMRNLAVRYKDLDPVVAPEFSTRIDY